MSLVPSLLQAIVRVDGEALVMHAGDKPYVVAPTGQIDLASRSLSLEAVDGIVAQLLSKELRDALEEFGAVHYELPTIAEFPNENFTVVAARGGDDLWIEVRRHRVVDEDRIPAELFETSAPAVAPAVTDSTPNDQRVPAEPIAAAPAARVELAVAMTAPVDDDLRLPDSAQLFAHEDHEEPAEAERPPLAVAAPAMAAASSAPVAAAAPPSVEQAVAAAPPLSTPDAWVELAVATTALVEDDLQPPDSAQLVPHDEHEEPAEEELLPHVAAPAMAAAPLEPVAVAAPPPVPQTVAADPPLFSPDTWVELPVAATPLVEHDLRALGSLQLVPHEDHEERAEEEVPLFADAPAMAAAASAPVAAPVPPPVSQPVAAVPPLSAPPARVELPVATTAPAEDDLQPSHSPQLLPHEGHVKPVEEEFAAFVPAPAMAVAPVAPVVTPAPPPVPQAVAAAPPPLPPAPRPAAVAPTAAVTSAPVIPAPAPAAGPARVEANSPLKPAPFSEPGVVLPMTRNPIRADQSTAVVGDPAMDDLHRLLRIAAARGASTLYLSSDAKPSVRVDGELQSLDSEATLTARDIESLLPTLMPERSHEALRTGGPSEWMCDVEAVGRVRCTTFHDHVGPGAVFRLMPLRTVSAEQLGLAPAVQALAIEPEGLILVVGPRSSGKRTLMSAFVDLINRTRRDHVITIEREINIVHTRGSSFISQREVRGSDEDLLAASRAALREDPDVLVIEDLRTGALINVAMEAAASGRLVIGGFLAHNAIAAVDRIIDLYAPEHRRQVQLAVADTLRGVIAQVLLKKIGGGRTAAREVLLNTPAVSSVIAEGKTSQLPMAIEGGRRHGMMPLRDALVALVQGGIVDGHEAYRHASDRAGLLAALKRQGYDISQLSTLNSQAV